MSENELLQDPTNRIVAVFDDPLQAGAASQQLLADGFKEEEIRILAGDDAAERVDTSAKWFADTDAEISKYQRELRNGNTVVSIPVTDSECRDKVHGILKHHRARMVTHFGQWVTSMMK